MTGITIRRFVDGKMVEIKAPKKTVGQIQTDEIAIEKGVPLPPPLKGHQFEKSPINKVAAKMEIGDSISIPYMRESIANIMGRHTGFTFTQRKIGDKLRIWRVA